MSKFKEYIDSLEGKTDLDIVEVVSKLSAYHDQEVSVIDAKVQTLTSSITEKDLQIEKSAKDLVKAKAENYDLSLQIPGSNEQDGQNDNDSSEVNPDTITPDDLFTDKE